MTRDEARARRAADVAAQRGIEHACALDFLVYGDDHPERGPHAGRCVLSPPCSRTYDTRPVSGAEPFPTNMYEGTGIGALYGGATSTRSVVHDDDGTPHVIERSLVAGLAGWTVAAGARYTPPSEEVLVDPAWFAATEVVV